MRKDSNYFGGIEIETKNWGASLPCKVRKSTSRVLTEDEINYVRENTGKIPLQEICKELHIWTEDLKLLCRGIVEMKKRPNRGAPKYKAPKFVGESSYVARKNAKKKSEQIKPLVSQKISERPIEECFANPIIKVNIRTGQVLHEGECMDTWT